MSEQIGDPWKTRSWWWWNGPHSAADDARFAAWRDAWDRGDRRPWTGPSFGSRTVYAGTRRSASEASSDDDRRRDDTAGDTDH